MKCFRSFSLSLLCVLVLAMAVPGFADDKPGNFPGAGIDMISHKVLIDLHQVEKDGQPGALVESLTFSGRMLIERGDPYTRKDGFREIPFIVKSWEAVAWSEKLNSLVIYSLADVPQKTSTITAEQKGSDYPATFHFYVTFDANAFGQKLMMDPYTGEPIGVAFMEVPPSGNRRTSPALTQFETTRIHTEHPTLGKLMFIPRSCHDEEGLTMVAYSPDQKRALILPRGEN